MKFIILVLCLVNLWVSDAKSPNVQGGIRLIEKTKTEKIVPLTELIAPTVDVAANLWNKIRDQNIERHQTLKTELGSALSKVSDHYNTNDQIKKSSKSSIDKTVGSMEISTKKIADKFDDVRARGVPLAILSFNEIELVKRKLKSEINPTCIHVLDKIDSDFLNFKSNVENCLSNALGKGQKFYSDWSAEMDLIQLEFFKAFNVDRIANKGDSDITTGFERTSNVAVSLIAEFTDSAENKLESILTTASECSADVIDDAENYRSAIKSSTSSDCLA